ncbi:MAG TPA: IPT/TIG domain-containing protein [Gemmatimonadota bacterium]|nr:IPT/TIG domain-containing protein [Gemmatimonadota bacterium]
MRVSNASDTVTVGALLDPPLGVRVVGSLGDPVEGVPVRFALVTGPGSVQTGLAVSDTRGVAEAAFQADRRLGESHVRVDVPSASQVAPLEFDVHTLPAGEVDLTVAGGDGQSAETGTQLALPFAVKAVTPSGTSVGGARVVWEVADGPSGATLTADTTYADPQGRSENLLTLGPDAGDYTIRSFAGGGVETDTVTFSARGVTSLEAAARLDSVGPVPLRPGGDATLYGDGFGTDASVLEVRVEGAPAQILTVEPDRIRFQVPSFTDRCLPARTVGVRALLRGQPTNGRLVPVESSGTPLALARGQVEALAGADALGCLQLPGADSAREYLVVAGDADRTAQGMTPLRLILRAGSDTAAASGGAAAAVRIRAAESRLPGTGLDDYSRTLRIQAEAREELARRRISGGGLTSPTRAAASISPSAATTPSRGDTMSFHFAVRQDLTVSCEATQDPVRTVVRAVGQHVALAVDVDAPAGGFDETTLQGLADEFDRVVYPTDRSYFGDPADLDGNGRILLVLTPRVNALTPRGSTAIVGGFFLPIDLVDSGDASGSGVQGPNGETCPASNEGELLYLPVPDPQGVYSDAQRVDQVLRPDRNATAHELQHLISAEQRLVMGGGDFGSVEEVWLGEGLSHIAEEVVGLGEMSLGQGQDLGWDGIVNDPARLRVFNTFELDNFARLAFFMAQPGEAPVLSTTDPGGVRSLQMRGFAWAFLRWVADHRTGASSEEAFFRDLARGGPNLSRGIANVEQAAGESWDDLLSGFMLSLAADDDRSPSSTDARYQFPSWNLPDIFQGLHDNPSSGARFPLAYPLAVTALRFESAAVDFDTRASTAAYFRLRSSAGGPPPLALQLASQSGGAPPTSTSPHVLVLRLH